MAGHGRRPCPSNRQSRVVVKSQSARALPWWHGIDMAQRRMLAALSYEDALQAAAEAFQAGLELTPEQDTLVLRCQEALEQKTENRTFEDIWDI